MNLICLIIAIFTVNVFSQDLLKDSIAQANKVDSLHQYWTSHISQFDSIQIRKNITNKSNLWFEEVERSVRFDRKAVLEKKPFHHILSVMAIRMYLRADSIQDEFAPALKVFLLKNGAIPKTLQKIQWGPTRVEGYEASKGIKTSPNVGILFYTFEEGVWKVNFAKSLPLIMRGLETVGVKKGIPPLESALFLMNMVVGTQSDSRLVADESLFDPI